MDYSKPPRSESASNKIAQQRRCFLRSTSTAEKNILDSGTAKRISFQKLEPTNISAQYPPFGSATIKPLVSCLRPMLPKAKRHLGCWSEIIQWQSLCRSTPIGVAAGFKTLITAVRTRSRPLILRIIFLFSPTTTFQSRDLDAAPFGFSRLCTASERLLCNNPNDAVSERPGSWL